MDGVGTATAQPRPDLPSTRRRLPVWQLDFPGCDARPMTLAEYEALPDERVEFFDSETGLAWFVREAASWEHEGPAHTLAGLVARIAMLRGAPVKCFGEGELRLVDSEARQIQSIHPDEMVFLHPHRVDRKHRDFLRVGEEKHPDVVLEVDHTTDVRRNRLKLYEVWGFPEVWVEVPDAYSSSRPRGLEPGLRIHLLEGDRYREADASRAFPGWRADEIHRALNEWVLSAATSEVLMRVGRALGAREGTGPEDDPLLRSVGRKHRAEGKVEGRADLIRAILTSRGIPVSPGFPSRSQRDAIAAASDEDIVAAAATADSAADFVSRLR